MPCHKVSMHASSTRTRDTAMCLDRGKDMVMGHGRVLGSCGFDRIPRFLNTGLGHGHVPSTRSCVLYPHGRVEP